MSHTNFSAFDGSDDEEEDALPNLDEEINKRPERVILRHNHKTRDVKPEGQCPACDKRRASGTLPRQVTPQEQRPPVQQNSASPRQRPQNPRPQPPASETVTEKNNMGHNHITRDIKPEGECPACDRYYAQVRKSTQSTPQPQQTPQKQESSQRQEPVRPRNSQKTVNPEPSVAKNQDDKYSVDPKTGLRYKSLPMTPKEVISAERRTKGGLTFNQMLKILPLDEDFEKINPFDGGDLDDAAGIFLPHLRLAPTKRELEELNRERAKMRKKDKPNHDNEEDNEYFDYDQL